MMNFGIVLNLVQVVSTPPPTSSLFSLRRSVSSFIGRTQKGKICLSFAFSKQAKKRMFFEEA